MIQKSTHVLLLTVLLSLPIAGRTEIKEKMEQVEIYRAPLPKPEAVFFPSDCPEVLKLRAWRRAKDVKSYRSAAEAMDEYVKKHPKDECSVTASALAAEIRYAVGDYEEALRSTETAVAATPCGNRCQQALYRQAMAAYKVWDYELAADSLSWR